MLLDPAIYCDDAAPSCLIILFQIIDEAARPTLANLAAALQADGWMGLVQIFDSPRHFPQHPPRTCVLSALFYLFCIFRSLMLVYVLEFAFFSYMCSFTWGCVYCLGGFACLVFWRCVELVLVSLHSFIVFVYLEL